MDVLQVMRALGEALNFTPEFFNPGPDLWGSLLPNGTFSGMVGRYYRRHRKGECGQLHHESQVVTKRPACNSNWCWYNFFFAQGIARISKKYLNPKKNFVIVPILISRCSIGSSMAPVMNLATPLFHGSGYRLPLQKEYWETLSASLRIIIIIIEKVSAHEWGKHSGESD